MEYFDFLPPEVQLDILKNTDPVTLVNLCLTSSTYKSICSPKYDYLWRSLLFQVINPVYNYVDITEFNQSNHTQFKNWYDAYVYFYTHVIPKPEMLRKTHLILQRAVLDGQLDVVKYLVEHGADIHYGNDKILIDAVSTGYLDIIKYLVSIGININRLYEDPLSEAATRGYLDIVKYLLSQGANIHQNNDLALISAVFAENLDVVDYLLSQGADIHAQNDSALMRAISGRNLDVVKYLVEHGADIHSGYDQALTIASMKGYLDIVKYLVDEGANIYDVAIQEAFEHRHHDVVNYLRQYYNVPK